MKKFLQLLLLASFFIATPAGVYLAHAETTFSEPTRARPDDATDLNRVSGNNGGKAGVVRQDKTEDFVTSVESTMGAGFGNTFKYFRAGKTGEAGSYSLLINIARDLKNVAMLIAVIYLVISVLRILLSAGGEEDIKKWKNTIIWTTAAIIVMQSAFSVIDVLFNENVSGSTARYFMDKVLFPFVNLLQVLAAFAFLAMAFYAFYRIVTAGGDEEQAKAGKRTIIYAILGFLLIKLPGTLIKAIYGEADCREGGNRFLGICEISTPNLSASVQVFTTIVNYINGFLALTIVVLILYSGFLVLTSGGDDEKLKKAKNIVKYIVIGVLLLVTSYILFNFFLLRD